jgi:hypothetical protein
VSVLTADDLLTGPRGRVLCMAVAHRVHQPVRPAWLQAAWHPSDESDRADLLRALAAVDPEPVRAWRDPRMLVEPVGETVSHAMYWQPPHDEEAVTADPAVIAALRPIAAAISSAPATAWWSSGIELTRLRYTGWSDREADLLPPLTGASEALGRWREQTLADDRDAARNRPADPAAQYSGHWWSTPAMASLVTTTRPLPGLGSVELAWQEDSFGPREATIWALQPTRPPRVWEIDGPDAWVRLVDRYPLDVTNGRRHDWYKTTGRTGTWCIPDWASVAADWDAVHLSVAGYLTTATRALTLADGEAATMLAGWNPDQAWWLTDALGTDTAAASWLADDDGSGRGRAWRRAARPAEGADSSATERSWPG